MDVKALFVGGYDDCLKGKVITEAVRRIAVLSPKSSILVVRDHFEGIEGAEDLELNVAMEYLVGGCFCCSMRHDFELLLLEKGRKEDVRLFVVEVPLTAELDVLKALMRNVLGDGVQVTSVFAIDPSIVTVMMETFPELMRRNLSTSDVLAINEEGGGTAGPGDALGSEWRAAKRLATRKSTSFAEAKMGLFSKRTDSRCWPF